MALSFARVWISSISIGSSDVQPSESPYLPVLFIGTSQSRQHDKSESPLLNGKHELLALDHIIRGPEPEPSLNIIDFDEAHEHLRTILVLDSTTLGGVKNLVVVHELETYSFPARFGEVQLSLVTLDAELEVFYPFSDNQIPDP
ncbi:hypothetical protein Tco_1539803 [Tanacetum coccineum]